MGFNILLSKININHTNFNLILVLISWLSWLFYVNAFFRWTLHPAAYPLASSNFTMGWLWSSIFTSWLLKWIILKQGGFKAYRRAIPFFFGLILGDYLVGGTWERLGDTFTSIYLYFLALRFSSVPAKLKAIHFWIIMAKRNLDIILRLHYNVSVLYIFVSEMNYKLKLN